MLLYDIITCWVTQELNVICIKVLDITFYDSDYLGPPRKVSLRPHVAESNVEPFVNILWELRLFTVAAEVVVLCPWFYFLAFFDFGRLLQQKLAESKGLWASRENCLFSQSPQKYWFCALAFIFLPFLTLEDFGNFSCKNRSAYATDGKKTAADLCFSQTRQSRKGWAASSQSPQRYCSSTLLFFSFEHCGHLWCFSLSNTVATSCKG